MNWLEIIRKNKKIFIGLAILAILLVLLLFTSLFSRIRNQQKETTTQTTQTQAETTITVSTTTPKDGEKNTYLDESIIITLDQDVAAESLSFAISPKIEFKATKQSTGVFILDPKVNLKLNQTYKIEFQLQGEEIFKSTQNNKYLFSFRTGNKLRNEVLKNITK